MKILTKKQQREIAGAAFAITNAVIDLLAKLDKGVKLRDIDYVRYYVQVSKRTIEIAKTIGGITDIAELKKNINSKIEEVKMYKLSNADEMWISVSDQLPEYGQHVLVKCDTVLRPYILDIVRDKNNDRFINNDIKITHWMPIEWVGGIYE